jgi:signal transduction histidine kinase
LVFCNLPFRQMFAIKPEWVAEKPDFDRLLDRMRETRHLPETRDFPKWKAELRAWFQRPRGAIEDNWVLPAGQHIRLLAQPLPDGGLLLIFEDRTEQTKLASARDTLLRVRRATMDNLFEAIGVFEASGRLSNWNMRFREIWGFEEAFLIGHPRADALAQAVAPLLAVAEDAVGLEDSVRTATIGRRRTGARLTLKDGRCFEYAAVPLPDGAALFTMLDITASQQIEKILRDRAETLEEADRLKTAFVAHMSYELRTPLTSIQGFSEMLLDGLAGEINVQVRDYVSAILASAIRLGALVDDVLDLTQSAADAVRLDRASVDVVRLLTTAIEALEEEAAAKQVTLVADIDPAIGSVLGDANRLRRALDHVLQNAVAYTPAGGRVLLHAYGQASSVGIIISDNGPGMNPAEQVRALDRFSRAGPDMRSDKDGSLGIGLPLAKQLIESHGGTLRLISEVGAGTTVEIELPRR